MTVSFLPHPVAKFRRTSRTKFLIQDQIFILFLKPRVLVSSTKN